MKVRRNLEYAICGLWFSKLFFVWKTVPDTIASLSRVGNILKKISGMRINLTWVRIRPKNQVIVSKKRSPGWIEPGHRGRSIRTGT